MITSGPPHYRAFRLTLVAVLVLALAAVVLRLLQPDLLNPILVFLHQRVR
jgi:hypothetical protein